MQMHTAKILANAASENVFQGSTSPMHQVPMATTNCIPASGHPPTPGVSNPHCPNSRTCSSGHRAADPVPTSKNILALLLTRSRPRVPSLLPSRPTATVQKDSPFPLHQPIRGHHGQPFPYQFLHTAPETSRPHTHQNLNPQQPQVSNPHTPKGQNGRNHPVRKLSHPAATQTNATSPVLRVITATYFFARLELFIVDMTM